MFLFFYFIVIATEKASSRFFSSLRNLPIKYDTVGFIELTFEKPPESNSSGPKTSELPT